MDTRAALPLLGPDDPPVFRVQAGSPTSPFFITCDHAGRVFPQSLGSLGLSAADCERHIAWDIGAAGLAERLGRELEAFVILQTYSRLVIDCNRPLDAESSIAKLSERTPIPGNLQLSAGEADVRASEVFRPYHQRIEQELAARAARRQPSVLIALHSFTPSYLGVSRPWHVGVLFNRDDRLARALLGVLREDSALVVGENEPYAVSDSSDYGVVHYGERRDNLHVELEIRQDLIADERGQAEYAARLSPLFRRALAMLPQGQPE